MPIIYVDTSALLKLYIQEKWSGEVGKLVASANGIGTSLIAYVEAASAMARASRTGLFPADQAQAAWKDFLTDWSTLTRLKVTSHLAERAEALAWEYALRGYDAVHLASAFVWQEALETPIILATFDRELWLAGQSAGLSAWPEKLYS